MLVKGLYHRRQVTGVGHKGSMCANAQRVHRGREGIDVIHRQRLQNRAAPPLHIVCGEERITLKHIGNQVAMSEHGPLGYARRAAGVLQHSQIISVENHCAVWRFGTCLQHRIQFQRARNRESRHHALHVLDQEIDQCALGLRVEISDLGDHNGLDLCARQDRSSSLCDVGLHDHDLHIRIIELMLQLSLGVQRVGVDHHHARAQSAQAHNQVLDQIRHLNRNTIAP